MLADRLRTLLTVGLASLSLAAQDDPNVRTATWPGGALRERYGVDEQGAKHGACEQWAENGTRTLLETWQHGERNGVRKVWTEAGQLRESQTFLHGVLNGPSETFHADGSQASSGSFRAGQRTGRWTDVDEGGARRRTSEYRDGLLHGPRKVLAGAKTLSRQVWKQGELVELDGLAPFPVPRRTLHEQLLAILSTAPTPDPADGKSLLRQTALLRLRAYRQLCGLPQAEMVLNAPWNELCDAAAELNQAIGHLDHTPPRPAGFDEARYKQGYEGASHSNLAWGGSLPSAVDNWMDDSDPGNLDRIGHRRWCLNPAMKKTAFGTAGTYHAMWSMDASGAWPKGLDVVCYPPRGYVPVDLFGPRHAFSLAMRGGAPKTDDLRVAIRPLDADFVAGEPLELDAQHVAAGGFGAGACLVFRAKALQVAVDRSYLVEVSADAGKTTAWRYVVACCEPVLGDR